jgi:uncharacterized protein (TIGR02246 family)
MSQSTTQRSAEEAAVRGLYQQFMDAWNRGSGAELAAVFTPDGDPVGFDGTHLKDRLVIAAHNQRLFDKWLRGTRLVGQVTDLRFLGPDVAVMHAVGGTVMRGKRAPSPERDSIQTLVATRTGGAWHLAASQNTRLRRMSENAETGPRRKRMSTQAFGPKSVSGPVSGWAKAAAYAVPLCVLPSALWRLWALAKGLPPKCRQLMKPWEPWYIVSLSVVSFTAALATVGWCVPGARWCLGGSPSGRSDGSGPCNRHGGRHGRRPDLRCLCLRGVEPDLPLQGATATPGCPPPSEQPGAWVAIASYAPLLAWGPLLVVVTIAYHRRRTHATWHRPTAAAQARGRMTAWVRFAAPSDKLGGQALAGSQPTSVQVAHPDGAVVIHPHQDLQREVERGQRRRDHGRRATRWVPKDQQLRVAQDHPHPLRLAAVVHHEEKLGAGGSDRRREPINGLSDRQRTLPGDDTAGRPRPRRPRIRLRPHVVPPLPVHRSLPYSHLSGARRSRSWWSGSNPAWRAVLPQSAASSGADRTRNATMITAVGIAANCRPQSQSRRLKSR